MFERGCPVFPVKSANASAKFYIEQLGFSINNDYGTYVLLKRDEIHLHLAETADSKAYGANAYFYVSKIDEVHAKITAKKTELINQPWGMREFNFYDLDGNDIRFGEDLDV